MKTNNRLIRFLRINFVLTKYGLKTGILFLKILSPGRFIAYVNPRNWFKKRPASQVKGPVLSLKDVKQLLNKLNHSISSSTTPSPDAIADELNSLKDKISSIVSPKNDVIIEHETGNSSTETTTAKTADLGQKFKNLWDDLNITQISGDDIERHFVLLVNKGKELKTQFGESMEQNIAEYIQKELPSRTELNVFFKGVDELSLRTEQLQAQVNQLMSLHEIN